MRRPGLVVLPTRVGMVRNRRPKSAASTRCSPRAWGWSVTATLARARAVVIPTRVGMVRADLRQEAEYAEVFPTRVGMVRYASVASWQLSRSPHARGDGPMRIACEPLVDVVLPTRVGMVRDSADAMPVECRVLPTRVGMVRQTACRWHARGACSPRAWGWSACDVLGVIAAMVLPTRVGMVR